MTALPETLKSWTVLDTDLRALVSLIETEDEYQKVLAAFEYLMEQVSQSPNSPLKSLYLLLAEHLQSYERKQVTVPDAAPHEVLHLLMESHQLTSSDLPEIGSPGVVSEFLGGQRRLSLRQAKALAQRFGLNVSAFL